MVACRPMRALVPLMTASVLAIAGWLASGIVTVRSLDDPARVGLLGLPRAVLSLILFLLVLSGYAGGAGHRTRLAASPIGSLVAVAFLAAPVALPWLPVPVPAALLAWTGPLAVGWWLACIAYVYADAFVVLGRPIARIAQSPTRAPILAAVVTGIALATTAWHTAPQHPKGDEPDYLIVTQSLLLDGDLKIENNHARADYSIYHREVLPPSYLRRGVDGAIYSVHAPGLPALLAPAFAVAGYPGAVATMVLIAMAGAWFAWRTGWEVTGDVRASWFGTLATVGAAPFFLHGAAIFPDAPASVLALLAVWALLGDRFGAGRAALVAVALGLLPWLHTRYVILSVGLGACMLARLALPGRNREPRRWRPVAAFVVPAAALAAAWFGFFFVVYGTPHPSAPYGTYTQMALAHLRPGLPGLLFDQQFGLLASAPVLALALVSLRRDLRSAAPGAWRVALVLVALSVAYASVVGAYRMWWGGLSAPARFLVPLILPAAPLIALAWQSLRTRSSRGLALTLLVVSLGLTTVMVVVDNGALAYNTRDGRARWAVWASPLVDLVAALPAAHRDAPGTVLRDAALWAACLGLAWILWRALERRGRLSPIGMLLTVGAVLPVASAAVWAARGVSGLAPASSQIRYLEQRAMHPSDVLVSITPPPVGRTRTWFDVEIDSRRRLSGSDFTVLRVDRLPAGRYRLFSTQHAPGSRLGVTLGEARAERFIAELVPSPSSQSVTFTTAVPVAGLAVRGSREAADAPGRTWLQADEIWPTVGLPAAVRTHPFGAEVWLLPEEGIYPESGGAWVAGDADVTIGLPSREALQVELRAGAAGVTVALSGTSDDEVRLAAGERRTVTLTPARGRIRVRTRGGFRPSEVDSSPDQRWLGVWIAPPASVP